MYFNKIIDTPNVPGKIVFFPRGKTTYVYFQVSREYIPEKKFNTPKRVLIGKLVDPNDRSKMYPNRNYREHFPDGGDFTPKPLPAPVKRSNTLKVGTFIALELLIKDLQINQGLVMCCPEYSGFILDYANYMIIDECNVAQHYPTYARCHPLFTKGMHIYSDSAVSWIFNHIERDVSESFLDWWNARMDHNQRIYVSYDSTNKNWQAGDVCLAEFGHAKDDKGVPIVGVALAFDQTNQVPLLVEIYPGSLNDVRQLKYLIDKLETYKYKSIAIIIDRGYFSRENIEYMDSKGYHFLMMVKGCKPLVSQLVDEKHGTFESDRECHVSGTELYGVTVQRELYEGDTKKRWFHLYFSPEKMLSERRQLENKLNAISAVLAKMEGTEYDMPEAYDEYFECHYRTDGDKRIFMFAVEKKEAITAALNRCGYFCLISSEKISAEDAYHIYSGRDSTEKLFRADKTFLGSDSMRVHTDLAFRNKIFVEFNALVIRNRIFNLLKTSMKRLNIRNNYMTVPAAIRELEKIEMTRHNGGKYQLDYALTRNQKQILQSLGISEAEFLARAEQLALELQEVEDELEFDDGEDQEMMDYEQAS